VNFNMKFVGRSALRAKVPGKITGQLAYSIRLFR
jgi:hypothetical protein